MALTTMCVRTTDRCRTCFPEQGDREGGGGSTRQHFADHNIYDPLQSAYRLGHSTETALVKVNDAIDRGLNRGEGTLLVLLDLSAAFATVDHNTLLSRLRGVMGIRGSALHWLKSYTCQRGRSVSPSMALCSQRSTWTLAFLMARCWVLCSS